MAILHSLKYILYNHPSDNIIILSDSKSCLRALKYTYNFILVLPQLYITYATDILIRLQNIGIAMVFTWVPGTSDIRENSLVDFIVRSSNFLTTLIPYVLCIGFVTILKIAYKEYRETSHSAQKYKSIQPIFP